MYPTSRFALLAIALMLAGLVTPASAAPPTLTAFATINGENEDSPVTITRALLQSVGNENDVDGGIISFKLTSKLGNTLSANVGDVLTSGFWTWTPPANANGEIDAFQVVAVDPDSNESSPPVTVKIELNPVNDAPSFTAGPDITRNEDAGSVTIPGWASAISAGPANESGQTVSFIVTTSSTIFSVAPAVSANGTLTFTTAPDANGTANISVRIVDDGGTANGGVNQSALQNFTITLNALNDAPVVGGAFSGPIADTATSDSAFGTPADPFGTITISDVDHNNPAPESLTATISISKEADLYGSITTPPANSVATSNATHYIYTISNRTPAQIQADLHATRFTPLANAQPVGTYTFPASVQVRDGSNVSSNLFQGNIQVNSLNDSPSVSVSLVPSTIPDSAQAKPFRITIADPDLDETFTLTIQETTSTPLGTLGTTTLSGTAAQINAAIQNVTYTPNPQTVASQTATFRFTVTDIHPDGTSGAPVSVNTNLTVTFTNGNPEITGVTTSLIRTTDDPSAPTVFPFANLTISDANLNQTLTATITLDDPSKGSVSGLDANHQVSGTAAQLTALIRAMIFSPVPNRLAVNEQENVIITISVNDGFVTRSNNLTQIVITYVNGAPVVSWSLGTGGAFPDNANPALIEPFPSALPFSNVNISDEGDVVVTVTLDDAAKGTLVSQGNAFAPLGSGSYRFTGTHGAAEAAIRLLVFVPSTTYPFPAGQPGRTNFTILATDSALNQTIRVLPVVLVSDSRNFLVTSALDTLITPGFTGTPGTLRHAINIAAPNDIITIALPSYPATIRLNKANGPLVVNKHLTFKGPGADKFTISGDSNSNGATDTGDTQIFRIFSTVRIEGIRLARGFAATGGAAYVGRSSPSVPPGSLLVSNSTISDCVASQWGGAIDVVEGSLTVERSLFARNTLVPSSGLGGGAVSLYTNAAASFTNTTFSGNGQLSSNGYGGGAIYIENDTPISIFPVQITHCTFSGNSDAKNRGSSIHSNVSNSRVSIANSVFADFSAHNLFVAGGGEILSQGGNVSNDNSSTQYLQGGTPQQLVLLNHASDKRNIDPLLNILGNVGGETQAHSLKPASPATGNGVAGFSPVDQRGVVRNATIDAGALDANALGRIIIHEIGASQTTANDFIEFYNPRNQATLNLSNHEIWIDGVKIHTLASPRLVRPGSGFVLSNTAITLPPENTTPVIVSPLVLKARGTIEVRKPGGLLSIHTVNYSSVFANKDAPATNDDYEPDSITLAPQFGGAAFVPHRLAQPPPFGGALLGATGDSKSPAADSGGTPFGLDNAYPIATLDRFEVTEDEISNLNVLANDLDADGADVLFITDVNKSESPAVPTDNVASTLSLAGATVTVDPVAVPLRGTSINFDPRTAFNSLPEGARVTDFFAYSVIDIGGGNIGGFTNNTGSTLVSAPGHRLSTGDQITISGCEIDGYNGVHTITSVDADSFSIPIAFIGSPDPGLEGKWLTGVPRSPTQRDTAIVEITVLGRNDPPTPFPDTVATPEDTILRILGDPTLVGTSAVFDTDPAYPQPRILSSIGILSNDTDPDTDDIPYSKLHVVGVCQATPISGYGATPGNTAVTVTSPAHGLSNGARILISDYGGHPSYNGYHDIAVTGPDTFTIPVGYIDDAAQKGLWTILGDSTRLTTVSELGAAVTLEIRANRAQTNIVYNPRASSYIDGLAIGELATDSFYYAVEDTHGAVSIAKISVNLTGTNDTTVASDDPSGLSVLNPVIPPGTSVSDFIGGSDVLYLRPSSVPGSSNIAIRPPGGGFAESILLQNVRQTDEDTAIGLSSASLLANDTDIDRNDILTVEISPSQNLSAYGAAITLTPGGASVTYDPSSSGTLQALSRNETVIDTFLITIFDGTTRVTSTVAVIVRGLNDSPVAAADSLTTPENLLLSPPAPGLLSNDTDIDQNTNLPDDRKLLLPVENAPTTVTGALVNIGVGKRDGFVDSFSAPPGNTAVTVVTSANHGIRTGEEVVITGAGTLTGQFVANATGTNTFSIPVPFDPSFTSLGGNWTVLTSTFTYDPRGSLSSLDPSDLTFTLQGLAVGQTYDDSIAYTVLDGSFLFANDDIYRIEADRSAIELKVLLNDTNLEGVATSRRIVAVGPPSNGGTVALNGTESIIYTPETGFVGDEVFTYTIEDSLGQRATATVTARVTVNRLNGNIQANDDIFTVAAGQSPLLDVLANDDAIPATGTPLTISGIASAPDQGGTAVVEGGSVRYTPDPAAAVFPYIETFSYTVTGGGTASTDSLVTVLVVDRANTLNVRADAFTVPANSEANPLLVLANDNILPGTGATLQITDVGTPVHGTAGLSGNTITYTPSPGFLGTDTFTYSAADGAGGTGTATITVTVGYLVTNSDFFAVLFDNPSKTTDDGVTILDVLANDGVLQAGGGEVTITSVTPANPALGAMSITPGNKSLTFDPAVNQTGQQEFTYTITDSGGRTATSTVTVSIVSQGVRANSDSFTVQTDSTANVLTVLANDLRISAVPGMLAISAIGTGPNGPDKGGFVEISPELDTLVYTPAPGFNGVESFTYTVTDGDTSDTARISIRSTNGELVAAGDSFFAFRGSSANQLNVLSNDRVIPDNGDILTITATDLDSGNPNPLFRGQLSIAEGGTGLIYTPAPENTTYPYIETFTYEISDGGTRRSEAVIRIEVLDRIGARDLDTNDDAFTVRSDSTGTLLGVLANDNIRPATAVGWTITSVTAPTANVASAILSGSLSDEAALRAKLVAHTDPVSLFLWNSLSSHAQNVLTDPSSGEILRINTLIAALNAAATGGPIYDSTRFAGVTLRPQTSALLLENPVGEQRLVLNRLLLEDAYPLEITPAAGGGTSSISGNGILYVPQPGFVGYERFTYRVSDGLGGTGFGEVIVRVGDISVSADSFAVLAGGGPVLLDVTANDGVLRDPFPTVPAPASADFTITTDKAIELSDPAAGNAIVSAGKVLFTPSGTFSGEVTMTYWMKDDSGQLFPGIALVDVRATGEDRDSSVVTVTVTGVNDPPMLLNAIPSAVNDKSTVNPFANATVIEFDDQRQELVTLRITFPANRGVLTGGFSLISPGVLEMTGTAAQITAALRALVFTPADNRITVGTTENTVFSVSMNDGHVATPVIVDSAVTTVTPVNDPPVLTGTIASQLVYQYDTLNPFASVTVTDVDDLTLQPLQVKVRIGNAIHGTLAGGGFTASTTETGAYLFTGTPAQATTALRALVFTPTPGNRVTPTLPENVSFTLTINDGFAPPLVDNVTSAIVLHAQMDRVLPRTTGGTDNSQAQADFGNSVAISGDTLVVGSPRRDTPTTNAGEVRVYQRGSSATGAPWRQTATLVATGAAANDLFGSSVAIDGDVIVVGAPQADPNSVSNSGAAYVFLRDTVNPDVWTQSRRLTASPSASGELFGTSVAIDGSTIFVGAPQATVGSVQTGGKVSIFEKATDGSGNWPVLQTISAPIVAGTGESTLSGYFFGQSLALDGNTAVISAHGANADTTRGNLGAVCVYQRAVAGGTWTLDRKLDLFTNPLSSADDFFGYSVDIEGDVIVAGAYLYNAPGAVDSGAAFVFERNIGGAGAWGLARKLQPATQLTDDHFGYSVAVSSDHILVGSPRQISSPSPFSGTSYAYRRNKGGASNWGQIDQFSPASATNQRDRFGFAVALDGFTGAVGAPGDNVNSTSALNAGSVRLYQFHYAAAGFIPAPSLDDLYAAWITPRFSAQDRANPALKSTVWGANADPDGDGIANMIEMLYGTSSGTNNASPFTMTKNPDGSITVEYPLSGEIPSGLHHVEWSTDLSSWSRSNVSTSVIANPPALNILHAVVPPVAPNKVLFVRIFVGP